MTSLLFKDITVLTEEGKTVPHAYMGVTDSTISHFRSRPEGAFDRVIEWSRKALDAGTLQRARTRSHDALCVAAGIICRSIARSTKPSSIRGAYRCGSNLPCYVAWHR